MKIRYTKKTLKIKLILGLLVMAYGGFKLISSQQLNWLDVGWLIVGMIYIGTFIFQMINAYLTIESGMLKVNTLFGKKINLNEVKEIRNFAGNYTLRTKNKEVKINTALIDPDSLVDLKNELNKLTVNWV